MIRTRSNIVVYTGQYWRARKGLDQTNGAQNDSRWHRLEDGQNTKNLKSLEADNANIKLLGMVT